jgi:hypothetical protein
MKHQLSNSTLQLTIYMKDTGYPNDDETVLDEDVLVNGEQETSDLSEHESDNESNSSVDEHDHGSGNNIGSSIDISKYHNLKAAVFITTA